MFEYLNSPKILRVFSSVGWAAEIIKPDNINEYVKEVRLSNLEKPGDDDIIDKLVTDFESKTINVNREDIINQGFSSEFTDKIFESKKNTIHENETSDQYYIVKVESDSEIKFDNKKFNNVKNSVNKIYGIENFQQITKILENKYPVMVNESLFNDFIDRLQY